MSGNKKYLMGLSDNPGEYCLYCLVNDKLTYLTKYNNSYEVLYDLNKYTIIGTSDIIGSTILDQILVYINRDINTPDFIFSMFDLFKYAGTAEFQALLEILNTLDISKNIDIYESELDHLTECIYPDNKELKMYTSMYKTVIPLITILDTRTLYDPASIITRSIISQIMNIFNYEAIENIV